MYGLFVTLRFILVFIINVFLARIIDPASFGDIAWGLTISSLLELVLLYGTAPALIANRSSDSYELNILVSLHMLLAIIFYLVIFVLLQVCFEEPNLILTIIFLSMPLRVGNALLSAMLQKTGKFIIIGKVELAGLSLGYIIATIAGYWSGMFALIIPVALLIQSIIEFGAYTRCLLFEPVLRLDRSIVLKYKKLGRSFFLNQLINTFTKKADYIIVRLIVSPAGLGYYSKAFGLMNAPNNLIGTYIGKYFFPFFAKEANKKIQNDILVHTSFTLLLLLIPLSIFFFNLSDVIIDFLLGPGWDNAKVPFRILTLGLIVRSTVKLVSAYMRANHMVSLHTKNQMYVLFITIALAIPATFLYGIEGTSIAVLGGLVLNGLALVNLVRKTASFNLKLMRDVGLRLSVYLLLIIIIRLFTAFLFDDPVIVELFSLLLTYAVAFLLLVNNKLNVYEFLRKNLV